MGIGNSLQRGSVLKIVSWNINHNAPDPSRRITAALSHLQGLFGKVPGDFVIMLQEVCSDSLQAVLKSLWVQENFALTNTHVPQSVYEDRSGQSFHCKILRWRATDYFTLMMIPKSLAISDCFRVPLDSGMGRDALFVDVLISAGARPEPDRRIRLCTTHLESLYGAASYRGNQLATICTLLRKSEIMAGLVGGDMNSIDRTEHELHRLDNIDLNDVWEDEPAPQIPVLKPFEKDTSYGRARGNTWGYQSKGARSRKRLDKFLYTGDLETVALTEPQDVIGRLGRVGLGLKTEVEAWEGEVKEASFTRKGMVQRVRKKYYSCVQAQREENLKYVRIDDWVSDHFGLVVGIKVN